MEETVIEGDDVNQPQFSDTDGHIEKKCEQNSRWEIIILELGGEQMETTPENVSRL